jgi:uncharacterized protein YbjT (DUF2867 family)
MNVTQPGRKKGRRSAPPAPERTAVVAGPTGLVGSQLVRRLLQAPTYRTVVAISRRPLDLLHQKLEVVEADYTALESALRRTARSNGQLDVFCCLGTTIRSAGSKAAFRRVDYDYVLALGRWARAEQAHRFVAVSALGADPTSRVFYNRVKGEMERDLAALGLPSLVIVRPSLLTGNRAEFRLGETLALGIATPFRMLIPRSMRPIAAADVAQAMLDAALEQRPAAVIDSAAMQGAERRARAVCDAMG